MRVCTVDLPRRLQTRHPGHRDIEDGEVGRCVVEGGNRLVPVGGLGDHLQIRFGVQDHPQTAAHQAWSSASRIRAGWASISPSVRRGDDQPHLGALTLR